MKAFALLLLCAGVAGCAAMSENECRGTDWAQLGQLDGVTGNRPRIDQYAYQCSQHGVAANEAAYMDGWWTGNAVWDARVQGSRM